jgi:serine/threonine protein kinase
MSSGVWRVQVADWPTLSEEENMERFHQEVSIMWSLSFHTHIIKLLGYTETPRCIVTKLYPTDLFRYLHTQDDKAPLESHLLLHLCSGMVSALAATHSMGIAHRDIKSPNYLMQEPRAGSPFPDPILCDFGLSRTRYKRASCAHWRSMQACTLYVGLCSHVTHSFSLSLCVCVCVGGTATTMRRLRRSRVCLPDMRRPRCLRACT